ncbi:MAG: ribonuclease III [Cryomorphaceae bacterium]|nr:ribonuclease III [Cryomorphaceae bacterium]
MAVKLRFLSTKKSPEELFLIKFIINHFGYRPSVLTHFKLAISHRSGDIKEDIESNERLEFLGDAILDAVVAEYLFKKFPGNDEGYLTKLKSKVVNRKTLAYIGEKMQIRAVLNYNQSRNLNISSLEGNAFEAIIGAIYLDGGFEAAKKSLQNHVLRKFVDLNKLLEEEIDFKSRLIIWCQKKRMKIDFIVIDEQHIHGAWEYEVAIQINKRDFGRGKASSKKQAEQVAARQTLELIGEI